MLFTSQAPSGFCVAFWFPWPLKVPSYNQKRPPVIKDSEPLLSRPFPPFIILFSCLQGKLCVSRTEHLVGWRLTSVAHNELWVLPEMCDKEGRVTGLEHYKGMGRQLWWHLPNASIHLIQEGPCWLTVPRCSAAKDGKYTSSLINNPARLQRYKG